MATGGANADGSPSRSTAPGGPTATSGWSIRNRTASSTLVGANGLRAGPDGRIYVAECFGGHITALTPDSRGAEILQMNCDFNFGPDDLDFDDQGRLYVTDFQGERVLERDHDGSQRTIARFLDVNGITCAGHRIFVDQCNESGRLYEVFRDGRGHDK